MPAGTRAFQAAGSGVGTAVWEYDVAEGRDQEFHDALKNSWMVMDYEPFDDVETIEPGQA